MTDKFEKSELGACLSDLGFRFRKNRKKLYARIPKDINLSLSDQVMRIVVYVFAENKDIPHKATELQVNGFSISFQRFEENELMLSKQLKTDGYGVELKNNFIHINS